MKCPSCGSDNREGAKFCGNCAAPVSRHWPARAAAGLTPKVGSSAINDYGGGRRRLAPVGAPKVLEFAPGGSTRSGDVRVSAGQPRSDERLHARCNGPRSGQRNWRAGVRAKVYLERAELARLVGDEATINESSARRTGCSPRWARRFGRRRLRRSLPRSRLKAKSTR
jgi:zinc ribbon protein